MWLVLDKFKLIYYINSKDNTFVFTEIADNLYDILTKYKEHAPYSIPMIGDNGYIGHRIIYNTTNISAIQSDYNE